jgi:hypothetical protein
MQTSGFGQVACDIASQQFRDYGVVAGSAPVVSDSTAVR